MELTNHYTASNTTHPFIDALVSPGPSLELGNFAQIYVPIIGSWNVVALDQNTDGTQQKSQGEWHIAWVLEGRAIQDIFICPCPDHRSPAISKINNRYGTTIRTFDHATRQWKIDWFNPVTGARNELIVRGYPDRIEQTGQDELGRLIRWSFSDVQPKSFYWSGEYSADNGRSWIKQSEFFATRK
ncbi:hypothetical protein ACX0G9_25035 [Flavitalea flava]